jgi:hypothetical protein
MQVISAAVAAFPVQDKNFPTKPLGFEPRGLNAIENGPSDRPIFVSLHSNLSQTRAYELLSITSEVRRD